MSIRDIRNEFYNSLDACSTLTEQINIVKTTTYDLYCEESQPSAICERFIIKSLEDAIMAGKVMIERFGNVIVDREISWCLQDMKTIVDAILDADFECNNAHCPNDNCAMGKDWIRYKHLYDGFISLGLKPASECSPFVLKYIYGSDPEYRDDNTSLAKYCGIVPNEDIKRELIEYLHQPRFISKWIESGDRDLLDYLM